LIKLLSGSSLSLAVNHTDTIQAVKARLAEELAKLEAKAAGRRAGQAATNATAATAPSSDDSKPAAADASNAAAAAPAGSPPSTGAPAAAAPAVASPAAALRLSFKGAELDDALTLADYPELDKDSVLEVLPPKPQTGRARFTFADGSVYEGQWALLDKEKRRHGQGVWTRTNGERYEGEWLADQITGKGKYYFAGTASTYEGELRGGRYHGNGSFKWASGATYTGHWHENRMHGQGSFTAASGHSFTGRFENDRYQQNGQWVAPSVAASVPVTPQP